MVVGKYSFLIVLLMAFFNPPAPKTILFFGDSLTAGYGLSPDRKSVV